MCAAQEDGHVGIAVSMILESSVERSSALEMSHAYKR